MDLELSPENNGGFAHHKDVKRYLYTPLDNVSPENLCKPESAETIEEYYKRANEVYKDLRFSEFKKWQKLKFLLEENELLRRANHREKEIIREEVRRQVMNGVNRWQKRIILKSNKS